MEVQISKIKVGENSIRTKDTGVQELMASITANGLLHPVVVTKNGSTYNLVAGHRRLAAMKKLGFKTVPVTIKNFDTEDESVVAQISENMCRKEVSLQELGIALKDLEKSGFSDQEIAKRVGVSYNDIKSARASITAIPKEYHQKIRRTVNKRGTGEISLAKANTIISVSKAMQLTRAQTKQLIDNFGTEAKDKIILGAKAIKSGKQPQAALKKIENYSSSSLHFLVDRNQRDKWEFETGKNFVEEALGTLKKHKDFKKILV